MCVRCFYKLFGMGPGVSEDDILGDDYSKSNMKKSPNGNLRNGQSRYGGLSSSRQNIELSDRTKQLQKESQDRALKEKALLVS